MAENSEKTAVRRAPGRPFRPGQSGNPGGRVRLPAELAATIAQLTPEMVEIIATLARSAQSPSVRLEAARYLTDRRLGKPVETTKIDATEGVAPPVITIRTLPIGQKDGLHG